MLDKDSIISESRKEIAFSSAIKQLGFVPSRHKFSEDVLSYYSMTKDITELKKMPATSLRDKLLDQMECYMMGKESLVDKVARLQSELDFAQISNIGLIKSNETLLKEVHILKSNDSFVMLEMEMDDLKKELNHLESWNCLLRKKFTDLYDHKLFKILFINDQFKDWYRDMIEDNNL